MGWVTGVPFMIGAGIFSLSKRVQADYGAHPASYYRLPGGRGFPG